ncbi:metallophosphatase [Nonlabens tegetincola]|uniref:metallophosphatase n=1 Tax=Nonlabens tegetincola TaxID=323273 RepID=UPI000A2056B5|nr:metallophosphatase [Nonlabens tegetincola]ARN71404.1 metallophosphatase [Nonlabens tegetincola]
MKRSTFLKSSTAAVAGMGLFANFSTANSLYKVSSITEKSKKITILHTNDTHSHIEPIVGGRNDGRGGVARRAALVNQIRKENPNTLLLDCGDIFQGTPYFNFYGGELEIKLMSMMGYDAATIGNHDFDNGIDGLYKQLPHANFDFVISNYDFKNTIMDGHTLENKIVTLDGIKIGMFGLGIELDGLVNKTNYKETKYLDPIDIATDQARILKEEKGCDLVICMSHLGYSYKSDTVSDVSLAAATSNIDVIIGGHTHTFLEKPELILNKEGKNVVVNQVGCYGMYLGRIDLYLNETDINNQAGTVYNL